MKICRVHRVSGPCDDGQHFACYRLAPARTLAEWFRPRLEVATVRWDDKADEAKWADGVACELSITMAIRRFFMLEQAAARDGVGRWRDVDERRVLVAGR